MKICVVQIKPIKSDIQRNIEKMGFGVLVCWVNDNNRLDDKIKNR